MKDFKKKTAFFPYIDQETMTFFSDVGFDVVYQEHDQYAADVMVFTGGPDVTPFLYGQKKIKGTNCDPIRDLKERQIINSVDVSMPKIGICRGAQFLNVYNGGMLWQDVDKHTSQHDAWDIDAPQSKFTVTSTHHQMMQPTAWGKVLTVSQNSTKRDDDIGSVTVGKNILDPEVVFYEMTNSLCVQYHPEHANATRECRHHFWSTVDETLGKDI